MLQASVLNVLFVFSDICCKYVYLDVAYIYTYVGRVLSGCCVSFAMAFQVFSGVLQVFRTYVLSVSSIFRHILQMFHLNVLKVDRTLHTMQ
jgi:hypothetical protein